MKNNDEELSQVNVRVPVEMKKLNKAAAKKAGLKLELVAEDAFRFYYGVPTPESEARRTLFLSACRTLLKGKSIPFKLPLTPSTNNSLTVVC